MMMNHRLNHHYYLPPSELQLLFYQNEYVNVNKAEEIGCRDATVC